MGISILPERVLPLGVVLWQLRAHNGWWDCFVVKLNSVGAYQWHTFFGSADYDGGNRIIVDKNGNLYIAGRSNATWNGPNNELPLHGHT